MSAPDAVVARRRTQAQRRDEAERALLDAAVRLFARRGIDNTSLAEIGEEAGYSRGLVNHHFGSKAALVERLAERTQRAFLETFNNRPSGNEADALLTVVDLYIDRVARADTESRAFFVMWGAAFPEDSPLRPVFMADDALFRDGVEVFVRAGQTNGSIDTAVDPKGFVVAFVALLRGIGAQFLVDPAGVDLAACKTTAATFVQAVLSPVRRGRQRAARTKGETVRSGGMRRTEER